MVNAAEPDGRGVMIRAGGGSGSSVSDENSTRPPEHVSANEKASPPAQDSLEDFNRKAAEAHLASMEAVRVNPSAALDLVMLQALGKMLAGIKVRSGRAPPSSLAQYGYYPNDSLLPNRQLTEDERGTSAKYPEVKGDGATAQTKKKATAKATKKTATKGSLAIVMTVPSDAPFDDGMDTPISPGPWVLISPAPAPAPKPPSDNPLPSPPHHRRVARSHSPTNERTQQSQAANPPPDGSELGALGRPLSRAPGSTPPTASARGRRLLGRNHQREHEHLHNEYGEQLTEEEHLAKALHESTVTSNDHACTPPVANDSAPSATENRAHSAAADTAHPSAEREVNLNGDDVVSDEEEILHLAAALNASTTDAVAAAPTPKVHYSCDSPVNGTIADHVRPVGPSDKIRAKNAKYWDDKSDDDDTSGDSDFGDERSERNPTALIANGKRPRAGHPHHEVLAAEGCSRAELAQTPSTRSPSRRRACPFRQFGSRARHRRRRHHGNGQRRRNHRTRDGPCRGSRRAHFPSPIDSARTPQFRRRTCQ